jgi:excisionase family DNA binding protein
MLRMATKHTNENAGAAQQGELKPERPERPEWLRPKQVPHYFGIGRTMIYQLIAENKIRSVSMRKRGQRHGTRLISYDSLSAYLDKLSNNPEA